MSRLFGSGSKKESERTVLVLDIEGGSVGAALLHFLGNDTPKLFAERRTLLPPKRTRDSWLLFSQIEKALEDTLAIISLTAAQLRDAGAGAGVISSVESFFAPPWSHLTESEQGLRWQFEPALERLVKKTSQALIGSAPVRTHAFGTAASRALHTLFEPNEFVVCSVSSEVTELVLINHGRLAGRATMPLGTQFVTRTLETHAGLSWHEAHSAFHLLDAPGHISETLSAAAPHYNREFAETAAALLPRARPRGILVLAPQPTAEWFARTLAQNPHLHHLFSSGSAIRALKHRHLEPYVAAHTPQTDIILMTEALAVGKP